MTVTYDLSNGVARIALARPERANALDLPTARALRAAVERAAADPEVRVVLLAGDGARFCAGGDVASMTSAVVASEYIFELAGEVDAALVALDALDKPVVAQVQGVAAGAGMAIMLSADLVISSRSTRYLTAYAGVGLSPDCGLSWLLPRAIGQQRALDLLLTGRILDAETACDWGLVTTVVDDDLLGSTVAELTARLAAGPAFALGQARRLVRSSWTATRAEGGADESRTIAVAVDQPETRQLIDRFAHR